MHDDVAPGTEEPAPTTPHLDARSGSLPEPVADQGQQSVTKPGPAQGPGASLLIRAARPDDVHRVALLLSLRGRELEQTLAEAPHMIASLPVLLLARLVEPGDAQGPEDTQAPPVALAGAFILPAAADHGEQWLVTGPIVDPDCPQGGVGRQLLGAVIDAVEALDPQARLHAVVPAEEHALVALHRSLGFTEESRGTTFDELDFGQDTALMLVRPSRG
ncbi:GNAT family N-acetyltransferase [Actinomyces weissii]|uniref:GNAT family N-acetyltransferase n=1 Tax=Actinomyces weissii TaxID=675090 RepID=A0A7T7S1M6_9ACTO|nr:hypothetical protein [Actinomyces weissii]QQM67081.1 hypothetical protein JG540_08595 [Actinomyces weissii]